MDDYSNTHAKLSPYSINSLTSCQKTITKGHLIDSNDKLYRVFPVFSPFHPEFNLGSRIVDLFPDRFFFNLANREKKNKKRSQQLNEMTLQLSSSPHTAIVVTDTSIKKDIATSISHVHIRNHPLTKTVHYTVYIMSTEAELFAIRCSINQACSKKNRSKIVVITNSIHATKKIFDSKSHPYQLHTTAILQELHWFFAKDQNNSVKFWECPSRLKWRLYQVVDKNSKSFNPQPILPS